MKRRADSTETPSFLGRWKVGRKDFENLSKMEGACGHCVWSTAQATGETRLATVYIGFVSGSYLSRHGIT